jgi:hypothetical protein
MGDMVPISIDRVTGKGRPFQVGDQLTDPLGNALTAGKPTPAGWGVNEEALSGDKTLVGTNDVYQRLDPTGETRFVNLPPVGVTVPFFIIVNTGTGGGTLKIRTSEGNFIATLANGEGQRFIHDGVAEDYFIEVVTITPAEVTPGFLTQYYWGGTSSFYANSADGDSSGRPQTHVMPAAGTIKKIYIHVSGTTGSADTVEFKLNDVQQTDPITGITTTGWHESVDLDIAVSAGDYLRMYTGPGGINGASILVTVQHALPKMMFPFAGWPGTNHWFEIFMASSGLTTVENYENQVPVPIDCTVTAATYASRISTTAGDAWALHKNGILSEGVTVSSPSAQPDQGQTAYHSTHGPFSTAYSAGDRLGVQTSAMTNQVVKALTLFCDNVKANFYGGAKTTSGGGTRPIYWQTHISRGGASDTAKAVVNGRVKYSWYFNTNPGPGALIEVLKNDIASETLAMTDTAFGVTAVGTTFFEPGDRMDANQTVSTLGVGQVYAVIGPDIT